MTSCKTLWINLSFNAKHSGIHCAERLVHSKVQMDTQRLRQTKNSVAAAQIVPSTIRECGAQRKYLQIVPSENVVHKKFYALLAMNRIFP